MPSCTVPLTLFAPLFMLASALLVSACQDAGHRLPTGADTGALNSVAARELAPGPYGCFISQAVTSKPYPYSYSQFALEFPPAALRDDGVTLRYQYRLQEPGKEAVLVANCTIPRTRLAVRLLEQRLKVPRNARYEYVRAGGQTAGTMSADEPCNSKVGDQYEPDKNCFMLEGVTAIGIPATGPGTGEPSSPSTGPIVSVDPTSPDRGSGGTSPCYNCGYGSGPMLVCPAQVTRGSVVTCSLTTADELSTVVSEWVYTDTAGQGGGHREPSSDHTWSGTAVHGGIVSVIVDTGSGPEEYFSGFVVTNRGWRWDSSKWSFQQGGAPACWNPPATTAGFIIGWNTAANRCDPLRLDPDPRTDATNGYSVAQVSGGPNHGWWYVTGASYRMDRGSNLNPNVLPGGPRFHVANGTQAQECRNGGLTGTSIYANFYEFNRYCKGVAMDAMITAAWAHEGFGSTGSNGHESVARVAAAQLAYDPYAAMEPVIATREDWLRDGVRQAAFNAGRDLTNHAANHGNGISGNWSGTLWAYNPSDGIFYAVAPNPFGI